MKVKINPAKATGRVRVPSSKSYAHRLVLGAALAKGESRICGVTDCEDIEATLDCARALGIEVSMDGEKLLLSGTGGIFNEEATLACRESGSTLRFFIPVALSSGGSFAFTGTKRLFERGISLYRDLFETRDISIENTDDGAIITGCLEPGDFVLPGDVSSQFVTGLLFALPRLNGKSRITVLPPVESRKYIDITIEVLGQFGIKIYEKEKNIFEIPGNQSFTPVDTSVEGDWSNAAFLLALKVLGGNVEAEGLNPSSIQGDRVIAEALEKLKEDFPEIDISDCPDLGPILFACAAFMNGARFTGTRRLRIKESDRGAAMAAELLKMGIEAEVEDNSVTIKKGVLRTPQIPIDGHNDHRIVMAMAVLCTAVGGEICGAEAVTKSYPGFFGDLEKLGVEVLYDT